MTARQKSQAETDIQQTLDQLQRDQAELSSYDSLDLDLLARMVSNSRLLNARLQELQNRALGVPKPKLSP